jgi:hypothetical protein
MDVIVVVDGLVVDVIHARDVASVQALYPSATCLERADGQVVGPGCTYDGSAFAPPTAPATRAPVSPIDFYSRFSQAQRVTILGARATDPAIDDAIKMLSLATEVSLDDTSTQDYVHYLASKGYITSDDAQRILA